MAWQPSPYSYPLVLVAVVAAALALYSWRRRGTPGAAALAALMAGVFVWSAGYAFEIAVDGLPAKIFWAKVEYLGIVSVPLAWLAFSLQYTRPEGWLTGRRLALLAAIPLVALLLVWTNEAHGLIWTATSVDETGPPVLAVDHGAGFWVYWTYSYLLLVIGTVLLVSGLARSISLYRKQGVALLLGALAPWVGNGAYVLGLSPVPNLDLTPFAFLFTGIAIALGIFRFRLLDLVPVARDTVIEGMRDGVIVADLQGRVVDLNPAARRILGRDASEAVGTPVVRLVPGWETLYSTYKQTGEAREEVELGEEKARREYDLRLSPVTDRKGRRKGHLILMRDITARKESERALRESEMRLRSVVANVPVVLFVLDRAGVFTVSEGKGLEALGLQPGEIVGRSVFEVYLDVPRILEHVRRALSGEAFSAVTEVSGLVYETWYSPLISENGEIAGAIGVATDITERKKAEEERGQRAAELARSNAELEQFAYSVSHDLRAPLRSINGFSQILLEDYANGFDEEGKDYLWRVQHAAERMGELIDDLLKLSRITRTEMHREEVDLGAIVRSVAEDLRRAEPGRRVEFVTPEKLLAYGDARLLTAALENLVGNAWKFTAKKPGATIEFGFDPGSRAYYVRDDGAGFDMAYAGKLFGPFQRLHASSEFEGTGIGLATVQRIVHRHGGQVWAEGVPQEGATFYFTL